VEAKRIEKVMGDNLVTLCHIGSTAVPGLWAKPVIDIMPVVNSLEVLDSQIEDLKGLGYEAMGEFGLARRRYFRKGGAERTHQLHAYQFDSAYAILRHLAFRDYLWAHEGECMMYGRLKKKLAAGFPTDIEAYCDGKDAFIKEREKKALAWYWRTRT
jgi:GrpB-like predicted nucleotidyltransferase (UPF0157 family)